MRLLNHRTYLGQWNYTLYLLALNSLALFTLALPSYRLYKLDHLPLQKSTLTWASRMCLVFPWSSSSNSSSISVTARHFLQYYSSNAVTVLEAVSPKCQMMNLMMWISMPQALPSTLSNLNWLSGCRQVVTTWMQGLWHSSTLPQHLSLFDHSLLKCFGQCVSWRKGAQWC